RDSRERQQIIEISKRFNLVSSLTSFVAIEHRSLEERNEGRPALRRVPVMLARGWGNIPAAGAMLGECLMDSSVDKSLDRSIVRNVFACEAVPAQSLRRLRRHFSAAVKRAMGASATESHEVAPAHAVPASDALHTLLDRQSADGWFEWSNSIGDKFVPRWKERESRIDQEVAKLTSQKITEKPRFIHTVLVLVILRERFADRESSWKRAANKARRWICSVSGVDAAALQRWLEAETFTELLRSP